MQLFFLVQKAMSRLIMVLTDFLRKCHYYSCYYGFWSLIWWIGNYCIWLSTWKYKADLKKKDWLWRYLERNYSKIIQNYRDETVNNQPKVDDYCIWVLWVQGKDNMPTLVHACYENLLRRAQRMKVVLLTAENLDYYLDLPRSVLKCLDNGMIGYTHLSDIIRHSLLAKYGGLWIDATVWVTSIVPVPQLRNLPFFSAKTEGIHSYWVSYLLGGDLNLPLFCFIRDMMVAVCEREKCWPDYLFQDYLIDYAFNHFPSVRETMLSCPDNNPRRSDLWIRMNKRYDAEEYEMIAKDNWMFKLSYKSHLVPKINGELTYYGAMINGKL